MKIIRSIKLFFLVIGPLLFLGLTARAEDAPAEATIESTYKTLALEADRLAQERIKTNIATLEKYPEQK